MIILSLCKEQRRVIIAGKCISFDRSKDRHSGLFYFVKLCRKMVCTLICFTTDINNIQIAHKGMQSGRILGIRLPGRQTIPMTDDFLSVGMLTARILTSPYAHARILKIDTTQAWNVSGVKAIITGKDCSALFGVLLQDRPALAIDKVRYAGGTRSNCSGNRGIIRRIGCAENPSKL